MKLKTCEDISMTSIDCIESINFILDFKLKHILS